MTWWRLRRKQQTPGINTRLLTGGQTVFEYFLSLP
jgi:hypothetical protein